MTKHRLPLSRWLVFVFAILSSMIVSPVRAANSTNFLSSQEDIGPNEADASSTQYQLKLKTAPVVGRSTSSNYILDFGTRWFEPDPATSSPTSTPPVTPVPGGPGPGGPNPNPPTTTPTSTPPVIPTPTSTPAPTTTPPTPPATSTPPTVPPNNPPVIPPVVPPVAPPGYPPLIPPFPPVSGSVTPTVPAVPGSTTSSPGIVPTLRTAVIEIGGILSQLGSRPLVSSTKALGQSIGKVLANPAVQRVEDVAKSVIVPLTAALATVGLLAQVPALGLLNLLQLLFFQPFLLLGYGKRIKAGQVYNTLSKQPIDLALIRLIGAEGRIVQSRVTSKDGLFFFQAPLGEYRIEVSKEGFSFPSRLMMGRKVDGRKVDIYHGEPIAVSGSYPLITPNIPLDPLEADQPPKRLMFERGLRIAQNILSVSGLVITAFSLLLSPYTLYLWILLAVHGILFILFRRLAKPPKSKGWGIVYDSGSHKPVGRAVARLFNTEFNKVVSTQITDTQGRYYFLAGDSDYQVRVEHKDYQSVTSPPIHLKDKEQETIGFDVGLKKKPSA